MELITVSIAARILGCSERWLRTAEKLKKIPRARRNFNGWRVYSNEDLLRLKNLLAARTDNMNLTGQDWG